MSRADIGVFGGSGFYSFLEDTETLDVDTPFGKPSAPPVIGRVGDVRVAFIPRHGRHHEFPPHRVPYRANVWAMKELGDFGPQFHAALSEPVLAADVDYAILVGEEMSALARELGKPESSVLGKPISWAHCRAAREAIELFVYRIARDGSPCGRCCTCWARRRPSTSSFPTPPIAMLRATGWN